MYVLAKAEDENIYFRLKKDIVWNNLFIVIQFSELFNSFSTGVLCNHAVNPSTTHTSK